jgi:hypothetical protein
MLTRNFILSLRTSSAISRINTKIAAHLSSFGILKHHVTRRGIRSDAAINRRLSKLLPFSKSDSPQQQCLQDNSTLTTATTRDNSKWNFSLLNVRSALPKVAALTDLTVDCSLDGLALTETWIGSSASDTELHD